MISFCTEAVRWFTPLFSGQNRKYFLFLVQECNLSPVRLTNPFPPWFYQTWDEALAKSANSWAKNCKASHNPLLKQPGTLHPMFRQVGENIWTGLPVSSFSVEKALKAWNAEKQNYTLNTNKCRWICGHYTQVN